MSKEFLTTVESLVGDIKHDLAEAQEKIAYLEKLLRDSLEAGPQVRAQAGRES